MSDSEAAPAIAVRWAERTAAAALVAMFVWQGFIPGWRTLNTDFPNYYLAARLVADGYPLDRMYDWIWFQRQKDHAGLDQDLVGAIESTPFSALVTLPLARLPPLAAKRTWLVANAVFLVAILLALRRVAALPWRRLVWIVFLAVMPLRTSFLYGQQHLYALFVLTLAAWLATTGRSAAAGAMVAAASVIKLYPLFVLVDFLRRRDWRALAGFLAGAAALLALGVASLGFEPFRVYLTGVMPRLVYGEGHDPYFLGLGSITMLLRRSFVAEPGLNPAPLVDSPVLFGIAQPVVQAFIFSLTMFLMPPARGAGDAGAAWKMRWAALIVTALLLSPGSSTYHFCLLVLAVVLATAYLAARGAFRLAGVLVVAYALISVPMPAGYVPRLLPLTALWIATVVALWRSGPPRSRQDSVRAALGAGVVFVALAGAGAVSQVRHVSSQTTPGAEPVATPSASFLAATPSAARDEIYFTGLDETQYLPGRTPRPLEVALPARMDLFYPAVASAGDDGWIELAGQTSRILRFPRRATAWRATDLPIAIERAEQPAVSRDGRRLAFLRPETGRGALWIADCEVGGATTPKCFGERLGVEPRLDVLDFCFAPDGTIVLSARPGGRPALWRWDPATNALQPLGWIDRRARFPAVSPDGAWIAHSEEEAGRWQLWLTSPASRAAVRITGGDCNSIMPAWMDDGKTIVYATDCGRGYGQTALRRMRVLP